MAAGSAYNSYWNISPQLLGMAPGQQSLNQAFEARLVDAGTSALLDEKPLGTFNLEYPPAYLASSSVNCVASSATTCRNFVLTIVADAPVNSTQNSYAAVTNLTNGQYVWVGPWTYSGSGTSYSVTMTGGDLNVTTPTDTPLKVLLYNANQTQIFDSSTPSGSPLTLGAPEDYFYYYYSYNYNYLSCAATAEDGYCTGVTFNSELSAVGSSSPVTNDIQLIDLTNGTTVVLGPVTVSAGSDLASSFLVVASQFGLAAGQQAQSQVFQAQLLDANSSVVLDTKNLGTLNLENSTSAVSLAGASLSCLTTNAQGCQSFLLTIDADSTGGPAESYAYVADTTNGEYLWVGPWTYNGSGTSYSVTLSGGDFDLTSGVSTNLAVTLYNPAQNLAQGARWFSGSPLTLSPPPEYFYNYYNSYNVLNCATTLEDGNCGNLNFDSYIETTGSTPVTSEIQITDLTSGTTVFLGPVTMSGGSYNNTTWNLSPQLLGLAPGQKALDQAFQAQLVDANSDVVYDQKILGTFNLEYPPSYIASSSITPQGTSPYQSFILTINADAPTNSTETSYAAVTNLNNGEYVWVGPWTYTGSGSSYSVTLTGGDLDVTTPLDSNLRVLLYNTARNQILDSSTPSGSPLTLTAPEEFFYYEFGGNSTYNALSCATSLEDGNCGNLNFESYLYVPGSTPVTSLIQVIDMTRGVTVALGPVTLGAGASYNSNWNISPQLLGLAAGQQALNQAFEAQLIDANSLAVLDQKPLGTFNLEYPPAYIASSSVNCVTSVGNDCQNFALTINADAPANVTETSYAAVTNLLNGAYLWVGPWTYTGSGTSYSVTLAGGDLDVTTPADTPLKVILYNSNQSQILDSSTPSGSPLTLAAPAEYFYNYYNSYNVLSCGSTAEDGNCADLNFYSYLTTSGSGAVTSQIQIIDLTRGTTAFLGPVTLNGGSESLNWSISPQQFGLAPGQQALNQAIEARLVDPNTNAVFDQKNLGTVNLEYPQAYIASSSVNCLASDPNGCKSFVLTINADAPANSTETSYAAVTDTTNSEYTWVGPWTYTGSGTSFSATLTGGNFDVFTPAAASLKVGLYNKTQNQILDTATPAGSPLTLDPPAASFYYTYSSLNCLTTGEDGYCETFNFNAYLYNSGSLPVTAYVQLTDQTNGASVTLGPIALTSGYQEITYPMGSNQFGLVPGQATANQVFKAQVLDFTQTQVYETINLGTLNLENP